MHAKPLVVAVVAAVFVVVVGACDPSPAPIDPGCHTVVYSPPGARVQRGDLCIPAGAHKAAAIVLVHGGGGTSGTRGGMRAWSSRYNAAGYVTFSVDYFLFSATTPPPVYPIPERDVKASVQYLRFNAARLGVDPDRILIHGSSAGSRLAAELYVSGDDPYFQGTSQTWSGISDRVNGLIGFYGPYDGQQKDTTTYYGGPRNSADPAVRDRWAHADSIANAARASGPAILFNGSADMLVPVRQMTDFAAAIRAGGTSAEGHIVPGAGHGFDKPGATTLSAAGQVAADQVLTWLNAHFPETS